MEMKKLCRKCFHSHGYSQILKKDGEHYVCSKDPGHRYKEEEDGSLTPL